MFAGCRIGALGFCFDCRQASSVLVIWAGELVRRQVAHPLIESYCLPFSWQFHKYALFDGLFGLVAMSERGASPHSTCLDRLDREWFALALLGQNQATKGLPQSWHAVEAHPRCGRPII